ncbi:MAG: hypothetical protein QM638_07150 [Nocardioides sp.]|uniref:hypothetical protein n=1 Tax=Nocardioides sp. TaxID=35761 RepID=UPI0039E41E21
MTDAIDWEFGSVKNLIGAMYTIDLQMDDLTGYAKDHVLDTSGLIGALQPLAAFFGEVRGLFDQAGETFHERWLALLSATEQSTDYLKKLDAELGPGPTRRGGMN